MKLSLRELDCLRLIAKGNTNVEAARKLGISQRTVEVHMLAVSEKLQSRSRAHAVVVALQRKILTLDELL